jgi:hypothetical protein
LKKKKKPKHKEKDKIMISTLNMGLPFEGMGHKIGNPIGKMDTPCHVPYNIRTGIPSSNSKWYIYVNMIKYYLKNQREEHF